MMSLYCSFIYLVFALLKAQLLMGHRVCMAKRFDIYFMELVGIFDIFNSLLFCAHFK